MSDHGPGEPPRTAWLAVLAAACLIVITAAVAIVALWASAHLFPAPRARKGVSRKSTGAMLPPMSAQWILRAFPGQQADTNTGEGAGNAG